jgi:hypothetical protein
MNPFTATEIAYKNGYKQGYADAMKEIADKFASEAVFLAAGQVGLPLEELIRIIEEAKEKND